MQPDLAPSLESLVSGKRRVPRQPVRLPVRVKGVQGDFDGMVHDLSMDGALVRLPVASLTNEPGQTIGPAEQFALLEQHFRDSFDLQFTCSGVVVESQVVRLLVSAEDDDELALGCRFVLPLGEGQQRELGLIEDGPTLASWGEATLQHELRHAGDPARPVTAFVFDDEDDAQAGPRYAGSIAALGRRALMVRLRGVTEEEAHARLSGGQLRVRVLRGAKELFVSPIAIVAARYSDAPSPGVDVLLQTGGAVPRAVRKHFIKA